MNGCALKRRKRRCINGCATRTRTCKHARRLWGLEVGEIGV